MKVEALKDGKSTASYPVCYKHPHHFPLLGHKLPKDGLYSGIAKGADDTLPWEPYLVEVPTHTPNSEPEAK